MKLKNFLVLAGLTMFSTAYIILLMTFFHAYSYEDKSVEVRINDFGEANIEAVLLIAGVFPCCCLWVYIFRKIYEDDSSSNNYSYISRNNL